jgi:hypothetical protein
MSIRFSIFYLSAPLANIFGIISGPMIRTMMSNCVRVDEQGIFYPYYLRTTALY